MNEGCHRYFWKANNWLRLQDTELMKELKFDQFILGWYIVLVSLKISPPHCRGYTKWELENLCYLGLVRLDASQANSTSRTARMDAALSEWIKWSQHSTNGSFHSQSTSTAASRDPSLFIRISTIHSPKLFRIHLTMVSIFWQNQAIWKKSNWISRSLGDFM